MRGTQITIQVASILFMITFSAASPAAADMPPQPAVPRTVRAKTGVLKDLRGQGLRITPLQGTRVRPGEVLTIQVDVAPGVFPSDGVRLGTSAGVQHDPAPPYSFEVRVPSERMIDMYSVDAEAVAGNRTLTDRATYVVEGGLPPWVAVAGGAALLAVALYAAATQAYPIMWLAVAALALGGWGLLTGTWRVRPSVEETVQVGPGSERYERREVTRRQDGTRAIHTTIRSRTVTRQDDAGTPESARSQYQPQYESSGQMQRSGEGQALRKVESTP